jgi:hypothetical protein
MLLRKLAPSLALLCVTGAFAAEPPSVNDVARWLAGLDNEIASPASGERQRLDAAWAALAASRTMPMREFASRHLAREQVECGTLLYPFSGPDALNAVTLFPACDSYVLFGLEPVGDLPRPQRMSESERTAVLADMFKAEQYIIRRNFFVTEYMRDDLNTPHLRGVVPIIGAMLVRMGYEVRRVQMMQVDGSPQPADTPRRPRAVEIGFGRPGGPTQRLFYANFDASDDGLKRNPAFLKAVADVHGAVTLLKAASYLLHDSSFSTMRGLIETRSRLIVQDDSGLPFSRIKAAGFDVELYGNYVGTIPVFRYRYQRDLAGAYAQAGDREPLAFAWSYATQRSQEALQIARRHGA